MKLEISYSEIGNILSHYVFNNALDEEQVDMEIIAAENGLDLVFHRIKIRFLTFKESVQIRFCDFQNEKLILCFTLKSFMTNLFKRLIYNFIDNKIKKKQMSGRINPMDYIHLSASKIHIRINDILAVYNIPLNIKSLYGHTEKVIITGEINSVQIKSAVSF